MLQGRYLSFMAPAKHKCPHCKKPVEWKGNVYRPFCSERCKLIDLGDWAAGKYRVAGEPVKKEGEEDEK